MLKDSPIINQTNERGDNNVSVGNTPLDTTQRLSKRFNRDPNIVSRSNKNADVSAREANNTKRSNTCTTRQTNRNHRKPHKEQITKKTKLL